MNDLVAGAWLGGTLDTSASVVAAGALISDAAMKTGVIVKFSQNALIGVAAFALAIWWALRRAPTGERPSAAVIWERFPKFVIGFVIASAVFSFLLPPEIVAATSSALNDIRTWWFALAFVCIGLETRFVDLVTTDRAGRRSPSSARRRQRVLDAARVAPVRRRDLRAAGDQVGPCHERLTHSEDRAVRRRRDRDPQSRPRAGHADPARLARGLPRRPRCRPARRRTRPPPAAAPSR